MRVGILAGGGGHSALAEIICEILKDFTKTIFIPEKDAISKMKLEKYGKIKELPKFIEALKGINVKNFLKSFFKSLMIQKLDVIISTGSNFCIFPSFFSKMKGTKLVNLEVPDRIFSPSITPKILDLIANITIVHWEEQVRNFRKSRLMGPLIYPEKSSTKKEKKIIIFTGTLFFEKILEDIKQIASNFPGYKFIIKSKKILPTPKNVIFLTKTLSEKEVDNLLAKASLVVSHPGYTMFKAISYKTPVLLYFPKEYRKHTKKDIEFLCKKFNLEWFDRLSSEKIERSLRRKPRIPNTKIKKAYRKFRELIENLIG